MRGCALLLMLTACSGNPAGGNAGSNGHLGPDSGAPDAAMPADGALDGAADAANLPDAANPPDATADASFQSAQHVHILIDNFCTTSADPPSFDVPPGQTLSLTWHNHSVDYDADVWLSYGGGYLGLAQGASWADPFTFCTGPRPYDAAGDVSIAGGGTPSCPSFRVLIHCL